MSLLHKNIGLSTILNLWKYSFSFPWPVKNVVTTPPSFRFTESCLSHSGTRIWLLPPLLFCPNHTFIKHITEHCTFWNFLVHFFNFIVESCFLRQAICKLVPEYPNMGFDPREVDGPVVRYPASDLLFNFFYDAEVVIWVWQQCY